MKIFKLQRWRLCFSIKTYFIKITVKPIVSWSKTHTELNVLRSWNDKNNLIVYPNKYLSFNTNILRISITRYYKNANMPVDLRGKEILINRIYKDYSRLEFKSIDVGWRDMFDSECLNMMKTRFIDIFNMCEDILDGKRYKDTGLHGDLNPNNVLVDGMNILVIDWENERPIGDFVWDIYWYCAILYRTSTKPGPDVRSLQAVSSDIIEDNIEFAIIYSAMKWHLDIERHGRDKNRAFSDLIKRLKAVNSFY